MLQAVCCCVAVAWLYVAGCVLQAMCCRAIELLLAVELLGGLAVELLGGLAVWFFGRSVIWLSGRSVVWLSGC